MLSKRDGGEASKISESSWRRNTRGSLRIYLSEAEVRTCFELLRVAAFAQIAMEVFVRGCYCLFTHFLDAFRACGIGLENISPMRFSMVRSLILSIRKRMKPWVVLILLIVSGVIVCLLPGGREYPAASREKAICPYQMETPDCPYRENNVPKF